MATLIITNVADSLYQKLQVRATREGRSVAEEALCILAQVADEPAPLSILALKGLGKDLWRGVDAGAYVAEERRAWD